MTRLPPLETLRVFEVACRHGSYSEAARELHVTHSAVSQRIRQLEEELGLTLFERQGNRMVPTPSGLRLQAGVKGAFSELNAALGNIKTRRTEAEIAVSLLPVMAARWLVPRLPRFTARYPHINLHIKTGQSLANFKSDGVDIAIRFGTGDWKGLRAIKLLDEELFPVCSPSLNDGRLPKDPASMLSEPLLIDRNVSWRAWFRSAGVTLDRDRGHFLHRYERPDGSRGGRTRDCARPPLVHAIGYTGGKAGSPVRTQLASFSLPLCGLPDRFGIQPGAGGFPGLAVRRGPTHLGSASKLADSGKQQLQDRRLIRFMVSEDQVERGHFSLHRTSGY